MYQGKVNWIMNRNLHSVIKPFMAINLKETVSRLMIDISSTQAVLQQMLIINQLKLCMIFKNLIVNFTKIRLETLNFPT